MDEIETHKLHKSIMQKDKLINELKITDNNTLSGLIANKTNNTNKNTPLLNRKKVRASKFSTSLEESFSSKHSNSSYELVYDNEESEDQLGYVKNFNVSIVNIVFKLINS